MKEEQEEEEEEEEERRRRKRMVENGRDMGVKAWFKFFGRKEGGTTRFDTAQTT